jgi:hypothetical protein
MYIYMANICSEQPSCSDLWSSTKAPRLTWRMYIRDDRTAGAAGGLWKEGWYSSVVVRVCAPAFRGGKRVREGRF